LSVQNLSTLTVTELTAEIRFNLSNEFSNVIVTGEVSGLTRPASGHLYFTLKDETAQISGIIWRSSAARLKFNLENGQKIVCTGNVDVYPQRGSYQLNIRSVQPAGEGALQLAFRQLHAKLESEGLFDPAHKKRLPPFPRHIAVVTSPSSAAVRDFLQVLNRRWPNLRVTIIPVKVQGDGAAAEIANAINSISDFAIAPDVVVVTRGGGSIEDLWSFNEEIVCRAIYDCPVPVVSGVGHEIDVALTDLVADVRALTPSEAAERIVRDKREVSEFLQSLQKRMKAVLQNRFEFARQQLDSLANKTVLRKPLDRIRFTSVELDRLNQRLQQSMEQSLTHHRRDVAELAARLDSINPLSVLARGYSLTSNAKGGLLKDANQVSIGDQIKTRLANGDIVSVVERKDREM